MTISHHHTGGGETSRERGRWARPAAAASTEIGGIGFAFEERRADRDAASRPAACPLASASSDVDVSLSSVHRPRIDVGGPA